MAWTSSAEMLEEAARLPIRASWECANLQHWCAERPASLLFAAAVLHFIERHCSLLPRLLGQLSPGAAWRRTCRTGAMRPGIA